MYDKCSTCATFVYCSILHNDYRWKFHKCVILDSKTAYN